MNPVPDDAVASRFSSLKELALLFLRLGATAFGGPAAHIAMMEREVVQRRAWLSHQEFLDLIGATSLIPGPSSTEMAAYIGRKRAGLAGIIVAGSCFIIPAVLIVLAIAWAYMRFNALPQAAYILYGVKPVVIAVIFQARGTFCASAEKQVPDSDGDHCPWIRLCRCQRADRALRIRVCL